MRLMKDTELFDSHFFMKRGLFISILMTVFISLRAHSQDELDRFNDTLKMGTSYLIGQRMRQYDLTGMDGKLYSSSQLKGKVTFIGFLTEFCAPCVAETPALNQLYSDFKADSNFQYLSFTIENWGNPTAFIRKHQIEYPVLSVDIGTCYYLNYFKGFPVHMIVGPDGKILYFQFGGGINEQKAVENLKGNVYPVIKQQLMRLYTSSDEKEE